MASKTVVSIALVLALAGCSGAESTPTTVDPETTTSTTTSTVTSTTTTSPAPTSIAPAPTTTTTVGLPDGDLMGWDSWTVIYSSLSIGEHERDDAVRIAEGIDGASVLLSDDYASLNPGYWVVYAGEWGNRYDAGTWCYQNVDSSVTCYPRYLGPNVPDLLDSGAALSQLGDGRLVAIEVGTGEILATFSDNFHWEAEFPAHFNLTADGSSLIFGLGWEDHWYSCESDAGQILLLDLDSGIEEILSAGWSPAISPNGRWLAIVRASECYPDPEVDGWVVSPGSRVEVYDISDWDRTPDYVLRTGTAPVDYDDPNQVLRVTWDPATDNDLLVWLGDGTVRRTSANSNGLLDDAQIFWASEVGELAAVSETHLYLTEWDGENTFVSEQPRSGGGESAGYQVDEWITGFALGRTGEIIITTWEYLILPSGELIAVEGGINNLAW